MSGAHDFEQLEKVSGRIDLPPCALVEKPVSMRTLNAALTQTWMLIAVGVALFGPSSASFALMFAMAKGYLDRVGGETVSRGMAALRMTSSLSWAIGPAAAGIAVWSCA